MHTYDCDWCKSRVSSQSGLMSTDRSGWRVRICPNCGQPTVFGPYGQLPQPPFGNEVQAVPVEIGHLYTEARMSLQVGAPTASVMVCRKILFNLAVHHAGMPANNEKGYSPSFAQCIEHLLGTELPKSMRGWLDLIREIGNTANHELPQASDEQAKLLIEFTESILKVLYEMPAKIPDRNHGGS